MEENNWGNIYKLSIRLCSDNYDFENDIELFKNYEIKTSKKGKSIFINKPDDFFSARSNVLVIDNIFEAPKKGINITKKYIELEEIMKIIKNKYNNNNEIKYELYISCSINNDQFGFEIDKELIKILSEYDYAIIISGIVILE
jgi:hypothetical protein